MSDDDDSLPHSGSFASLPRSPARSCVQILKATGSFASSEGDVSGGRSSRSVSSLAASDDDGLGTELSGLQRVSEELHKEIADVSTEDIDILVPDDDGELPKTPSRTLVIGIIPESDESGGSNDETKSTPDRLVDTYTSDVATPLRAGRRDKESSSGSRSASSGDSAIVELRSIDNRSNVSAAATSFVTPPGDGESVVTASSASITGSYSILRGVIPSPSVASSRGSSPTKSLKSVARSLRSIGSKSSRSKIGNSDNEGGKGPARKSSSTSSPVRKLLNKSVAFGAAAAGGVAVALTGKPGVTASTPARSALSLGSGDIVHSGDTPAPSQRTEKKNEGDIEDGSSDLDEAPGRGAVAAFIAGAPKKESGVPEKGSVLAEGDNQVKLFALGCTCLSLIMVILLAVGLSLGFTRRSGSGPPPPPTMPPVTRRPTRAPTLRVPTISAPVSVPTPASVPPAPSTIITAEPSREDTPPLTPTTAPTTSAPTVDPVTEIPTGVPTVEPTVFEAERYIKDIAPDPIAVETPGTSQNLAYEWLLSQDNVDDLSPTELEQKFSLATIFYSTGGEDVKELDGWLDPNIPECEWFGVECVDSTVADDSALQSRQAIGSEVGIVVKLQLAEVGLEGEIPSEILLLKDMKELVIYGNNLEGELPAGLYNLTNLEILEVDRNALSGSVASDIGNLQSLRTLRLDHNALSGSLPQELGTLASLKKIRLDTNRFTGSVPSNWGFLSAVETLMLHRNYIVGEVPLTICLLTFDRLITLSSDCANGGSVTCICCTLCSTGYPEYIYNDYTSWQGYPPEYPMAMKLLDSEDGGFEDTDVGEEAEADLAAAMNKVVGTLPKLESPADNNGKEVERHEIRRDVFVPCSWVTRKPSEKENRCKKKTIEGTLLSELCPSQCS